jgi:type VI secretion system protein ImpD
MQSQPVPDVETQATDELLVTAHVADVGSERHSGPLELSDLLQEAAQRSAVASPVRRGRLDAFLQARTVGTALREWVGTRSLPDADSLTELLNRAVAAVDELVNEQLNEILHHERFQRLEASWRGLAYLTSTAADLLDSAEWSDVPDIRVRVLNASLKDIDRDFQRAIEFDQSHVFRQVYSHEFGMPGGTPLGLLVADYEFRPWPDAEFPHNGLSILESLAAVGAASFCPVVTAASPRFFELESFDGLARANLSSVFDANRNAQFIKWKAFRESEDSRFLSLTVPRVLFRTPYEDDFDRVDGFRFQEDTGGPDRSRYLWGNAAYAFGEVALRAFAETGWLANISGVTPGQRGGGLITGLPSHSFATDRRGLAVKSSVEVAIPDVLEREIAEAGFLPVCHCHDTEFSAFYNSQTSQKPRVFEGDVVATLNAKMSSMMQYMLCVSQFARYIKVIARDKVGSFATAEDCEGYLQNWITGYVTKDDSATPEARARFPLYEARVRVFARAAEPGVYQCEIALQPHYELYDLSASVRMQTELRSPGT